LTFMRRRISPAVLVAIALLVIVGGVLHEQGSREHRDHRAEPQYQSTERAPSPPPAPSVPTTAGTLIKYGDPVPHKLVGPYHVLINQGYVSGYDAGIQAPRWVETRFFAVSNPSSAGRPSEFSTDERIEPEYQVNTHYWTATGYDRGHMAPNWGVSICYGRDAQVETFLLTNVVPQSPALNRGLWETLEKIISNDYAERFGQVWVICGPIFGPDPGTLKDGKVLIPESCYKIVLRVDQDGSPHALAFVMPQDLPMGHQQRDLLQYVTTISKVEVDTGISFFPALPSAKRASLENEDSSKLW
jgi:endonuclease G